jgi:hypothetical protein
LCDPVGKLYTEDNARQLVRVLQYAAEYKSSSEPRSFSANVESTNVLRGF